MSEYREEVKTGNRNLEVITIQIIFNFMRQDENTKAVNEHTQKREEGQEVSHWGTPR